MRTKLLLSGLFAVAVALPCPAQAPPKADAKPVVVPFKLLPSRHMILDVKVNGKGPYTLIFDTGAPLNLVSTRLAKETGLTKKKRGGFGFGFLGGADPVEVETLAVGGVTAKNLPAVVMDHPTVRAISDAFEDEHGKIEGIVGFPFFARFASTIDYQKKELTLKPTDFTPGDFLNDIMKTVMTLGEKPAEPKVVGSAGLWGLTLGKNSDDTAAGVDVRTVFAGGPAARAGLKAGDRVLTLDGRWTDTLADAYLAASLVKPGRTVEVAVKRDGKDLKLSVTPVKGY
jgi:hypothetical protein